LGRFVNEGAPFGFSGQGHVLRVRPAPFTLTAAFVLVYWALAAFGRDLQFNHNIDADLADDKIGALLPYLRVAACAFAALAVVGTSGLGWAVSRLPLSLAPFCLWTLLTVLWTDSVKDTLRGALTLLAAWGAVPILLHRLGAVRSARLMLHMIVVVCCASFLVAILLPSVGRHSAADLVQGAHDGRWRGIFSHKNGLGPWAAYGAVLPLLYGGVGMSWTIRIVGAVCALVCLIFSGSATAMALAALCLGLHVAFRLLGRWSAGIKFLIASAAVLVAGLVAEIASTPLLAALGRSENFSGRGEIWRFAWEYVADNPWLGYGYATLGGADLRNREASLFAQVIPGPESGYLNLLLETGLVGCGLFLAAYLACLTKGFVWLKRSAPADRIAVEFYLIIVISTLAEAVSESNAFVVTGYDGVIFFAALFGLSTARWPSRGTRHALGSGGPQVRQREKSGETAPKERGVEPESVDDDARGKAAQRHADALRRA
jgi:O-antigen ligase